MEQSDRCPLALRALIEAWAADARATRMSAEGVVTAHRRVFVDPALADPQHRYLSLGGRDARDERVTEMIA